MVTTKVTEGTVPFRHPSLPDGQISYTWYRVVGDLTADTRPLVTLHGGPGIPHTYLPPTFDALPAKTGQAVIYYDQIGCGKSTHWRGKRLDEEFWSIELFIAELDNLLDSLGVGSFDLYGLSWGAMMAAKVAVSGAKCASRLNKLVIASGPVTMKEWSRTQRRLLKGMPESVQRAIEKAEETGDYKSEEYEAAVLEYYKVHLCRLWPFPDGLNEAFEEVGKDDTVYLTMCGPSEITITGNLRDFDMTEECKGIKVPTLVLNGEFDEAQDSCVEAWFRGIDKVKWITIPGAGHMGNLEQPEKYLSIVSSFLKD